MLGNPKKIREAAIQIASLGMAGLQAAYGAGKKTQEPDITSAIVNMIAGGLWSGSIAGLRWKPMVLPSKGAGAAEKLYGADVLIILDIQDGSQHVQKGVLVQSKMAQRRDPKLPGQCADMLRLTSAAFVFRFSPTAVTVERATKYCAPAAIHSVAWSFEDFIYEFLACNHGDTQFQAATLTELERAAAKADARQALLLKANSP